MSEQSLVVLLALVFQFGLPLLLLVVAFFTGNWFERKHYASILAREEALRDILVFSSRRPPDTLTGQQLVRGSVVISSDYFRRMLAGVRQIFGGRVRSHESLLDRGRREAILRMKEQARASGADVIFNVKLDTASLSGGSGGNGTVEVMAYGTAGRLSGR